MWFGSSSSLRRLSQSTRTVTIGTKDLQPAESIRNIGVYVDSKLSMQTQVTEVMRTCFFQLRLLRQIRRLLGRDVTANVAPALVHADTTWLQQRSACRSAVLDRRTVAACHQHYYAASVRPSTERPRHGRTPPWSCTGCRSARRYSTNCLLVHRTLNSQSANCVSSNRGQLVKRNRILTLSKYSMVTWHFLRRRAASACHWTVHETFKSAVSRREHYVRSTYTYITDVWHAGVKCCWSHSLEQPSGTYPYNYQHPSFQ